jgi:hypothetical protein
VILPVLAAATTGRGDNVGTGLEDVPGLEGPEEEADWICAS